MAEPPTSNVRYPAKNKGYTFAVEDSTTGNAHPLTLYRRTTIAPVNGMASTIQFGMDDDAQDDNIVSEFGIVWEDIHHATRVAWFTFRAMNDGKAMADVFQIIPDGAIRIFNDQTDFYAQILTSSSMTGNRTYELPPQAGIFLLTTDASGNAWVDSANRKLLASDGVTEVVQWEEDRVEFFNAKAKINADGSINPGHLADVDAANDTIYYSTTASKLVYKDPGGTVRALY